MEKKEIDLVLRRAFFCQDKKNEILFIYLCIYIHNVSSGSRYDCYDDFDNAFYNTITDGAINLLNGSLCFDGEYKTLGESYKLFYKLFHEMDNLTAVINSETWHSIEFSSDNINWILYIFNSCGYHLNDSPRTKDYINKNIHSIFHKIILPTISSLYNIVEKLIESNFNSFKIPNEVLVSYLKLWQDEKDREIEVDNVISFFQSLIIKSLKKDGKIFGDFSINNEISLSEKNNDSFHESNEMNFSDVLGYSSGIVKSSKNYEENVVLSASRGHGFAAEKANHLYDKLHGENASIIGGDNAKNGADRLVNGIKIQTKYCNSGSKCISECFEDGVFRYTDMQIEVPSDYYDDAVKAFRNRIEKGQVPGVTDPSKAEEIVRKGHFTYQQARNIAKFGTVESLTYDTVNGIQLAGTSFGLSSVLSFSVAIWNGEDISVAIKDSCYAGIKVGGMSWASSIITAQLGRTGLEQSLRGATDFTVKSLGPKVTSLLANGLRSGKDIYGAAAANYLSKVLRGNVVTGVVTTTLLSSVDFYHMFSGKMSGAQVFKNVSVTASGVAGGTGGWLGGAAAGAAIGSFIPGIGTSIGGVIGGILGSIGGGTLATKTASSIMDNFIEDDANEMKDIFLTAFSDVANDFLFTQDDADNIYEKFNNKDIPDFFRDMYAAKSHYDFAREWLETEAESVLAQREPIDIPKTLTPEQVFLSLSDILEESLA